jgi:ferredoxin
VPHFARTPEEAAQLVVGPVCGAGLAKYLLDELPGLTEDAPAVVVARGCDLMGVRRLVADHRVNASLVKVLAIPCVGRFAARKVAAATDGAFAGQPGAFLAEACLACRFRRPEDIAAADGQAVGLDLTALRPLLPGAPAIPAGGEGASPVQGEIAAIAALSPAARMAYWSGWFAKCIRCYACRSVCPACHCEVCVLDSLAPAWLPRSTDLPRQFMFQFIRGMDVAGRCVGCGQCEDACPAGIPLAQLWAKTAADVGELFGVANPFLPGTDEPLGVFDPRDPEPSGPARP